MSKRYERIVLTPLDFRLEGQVLDGSYTNQAIKVQTVTVDDFDNGFLVPDGSGGFTGPDFQDITFD